MLYDDFKELQDSIADLDVEEARAEADALLAQIIEFHDTLDENLRWNRILQRDTEMYMDDAESVEAFYWAPEYLQEAVILFAQGLEALRMYELDKSIDYLSEAKGLALKAVRTAPQRKAEYKTNSLMREIEEDIEAAEDLTIMTEDGRLIGPEAEAEPDQQSFLLTDGNIGVLGDFSEYTLLDQAKELWRKGVEEKEKGNLEKADEYFEEAGKLLHEYRGMAIGETKPVTIYKDYTLWHISDVEYGSPFLWPIVWLYNRELIKNPDFILPGWEILIPLDLP